MPLLGGDGDVPARVQRSAVHDGQLCDGTGVRKKERKKGISPSLLLLFCLSSLLFSSLHCCFSCLLCFLFFLRSSLLFCFASFFALFFCYCLLFYTSFWASSLLPSLFSSLPCSSSRVNSFSFAAFPFRFLFCFQ